MAGSSTEFFEAIPVEQALAKTRAALAELVDAVSTLSLTPPPETTRRAMMVRVEI